MIRVESRPAVAFGSTHPSAAPSALPFFDAAAQTTSLSAMPQPYFGGKVISSADRKFIDTLSRQSADMNVDLCREFYLFSTARLTDTVDTGKIFDRYPDLQSEETFNRLKALFDAHPRSNQIKRLFAATLDTYVSAKLSKESDALAIKSQQVMVNVSGLGVTDKDGAPVAEIKYTDLPGKIQNEADDTVRNELYKRMQDAYEKDLKADKLALLKKQNDLMIGLGYSNLVDFYGKVKNHDLRRLSGIAADLVEQTQDLYDREMGAYYTQRTGKDFADATRGDALFVRMGEDPALGKTNSLFTADGLVPLAEKTFNGMGLNYTTISRKVNYGSLAEFDADVVQHTGTDPRILLDMETRPGKNSRACVYPSKPRTEVYLTLKPESGLSDSVVCFHENGHALHFAYTDPGKSYIKNGLGNYAVTESYAYLFEKLHMNTHWLENMAGLTPAQAKAVQKQQAAIDLMMLRRYCGKMQFETELFDRDLKKEPIDAKKAGELYESILTKSAGFKHGARDWSDDVDAGFYVADYFTAWALEAQLKDYLERNFGTRENGGQDWYQNPRAGAFMKKLWDKGNPDPAEIARAIGSKDANDTTALIADIRERLEG